MGKFLGPDSKIGKFVHDKVKPVLGDVLEFVGETTGVSAIDRVGEFLNNRAESDAQAKALSIEFEEKRLEFELEITRLELEAYRVEVQDRADARAMRNEFTKQGKHDWLMYAVAAFLLFVVGYMVYVGLNEELTDKQYEIYCRLEGILIGGALMMLFSFLWGTTRGSQRKTDAMERMIPKK